MSRFLHHFVCAIGFTFCSLPPSCLNGADLATTPPALSNGVALKHVQLKSNEARLTYIIDVQQPTQPITLHVDGANAISSVVSSLTVPENPQRIKWKITEGGFGTPHQIELKFPEANIYEFNVLDSAAVTASPQYRVIAKTDGANGLNTAVIVDLRIEISKSFEYPPSPETTLTFKDGGIDHHEFTVGGLQRGETAVISDVLTVKVKQNLAYWVNDSDFSPKDAARSSAEAQLQFPMKGNWPKQLTLPGKIDYFLRGKFELPSTEPNAFETTVAKDFYTLDGSVSVSRTSSPHKSGTDSLTWPRITYIKRFRYPTVHDVVYVRFQNGKPILASVGHEKDATLCLTTSPGEDNSSNLKHLNEILEGLAQEDERVKPLNQILVLAIPILEQQEDRIKALDRGHMALVNSLDTADERVKVSRAKLESAKRAAAALVESYNAAVMSYPE